MFLFKLNCAVLLITNIYNIYNHFTNCLVIFLKNRAEIVIKK